MSTSVESFPSRAPLPGVQGPHAPHRHRPVRQPLPPRPRAHHVLPTGPVHPPLLAYPRLVIRAVAAQVGFESKV